MFSMQIKSVEVGLIAFLVPPGTFVFPGTIVFRVVVIKSAEWLVVVIGQRITFKVHAIESINSYIKIVIS